MPGHQLEPVAVADLSGKIGRLVGQQHVLRDGQVGHQGELLERRLQPVAMGVARAVEMNLPALQQDATGIRANQATQRLHQRRLAGAVLAEQGMDLARLDLEAGAVERHGGAEGLAHGLDGDGGSAHGMTQAARPTPFVIPAKPGIHSATNEMAFGRSPVAGMISRETAVAIRRAIGQ